MKLRKTASVLTAAALITASLAGAGCAGSGLDEKTFVFGDEYYKSVSSRHVLNYDEMLYDDFTNGIDLDRWVISDSVWEQWETDQNGVRPQNVFLVDDKDNPETHLLLRANGSYYNMYNDKYYTEEEKALYGDGTNLFTSSQSYGVNTGACISTIEALGPGRYEVKMKACPRVGALTSMWVYSWFTKDDGSTQQNEIDIEIGLEPDFSNIFYTTWTSPDTNTDIPTPVDYYLNDGDWHVYSFDWVTDVAVPYVDYFIDGVKILTIDSNVPTTNATLNLGIWCPSWAGGGQTNPDYDWTAPNSRIFESDYAEISWWRYIPFQMEGWEQRTVINRSYADGYVPKTLTSLPMAEKCANGDFERADESYGWYGNPWQDCTVTDEADFEFYIPGSSAGITEDGGNRVAQITNGGLLGQWLRGAAEGFTYRLTGKYRTTGDAEAALRYIYYLGYDTESPSGGLKTLTIGKSEEWKEFTLEFTVDGTSARSIRYFLINSAATRTGGQGSCYFDDLSLVYLGH